VKTIQLGECPDSDSSSSEQDNENFDKSSDNDVNDSGSNADDSAGCDYRGHPSPAGSHHDDTSIQQTVFGVASTNGSFSKARQQTVRFRRRLNKRGKSFFDILN